MRSIRSRFTVLTTSAVIISVLATIMTVSFTVTGFISRQSDDILRLVCAEKKEELDRYFDSIEQSVDSVAEYAMDDLGAGGDIIEHVSDVEKLFSTVAKNTKGTLTYYYRLAPEVAGDRVGFWYQLDTETNHFVRSELTEIEKYDPDNVSRVGWYYIPRKTGLPVWLSPYNNDNMGVKMISYVVPVYSNGTFMGVVGMDFSYDSLVANMEDIAEFDTGYAFLADANKKIIYHKDLKPGTPVSGILDIGSQSDAPGNGGKIIHYAYDGVERRAASTLLSNDMRLYVTVEEAEITSGMRSLITKLLVSAVTLLAAFILITTIFVRRITEPLRELTKAAEALNSGDYDAEIDCSSKDEIGMLSNTFLLMRDHIKSQIGSLNAMAYRDSLTSIRNKSALDDYIAQLDEEITSALSGEKPEFAVCMFDCNDLKFINDRYGHDKGDQYIKASCTLICDAFQHSAVFRSGGDEFVAVLRNADYENREEVCREFDRRTEQTLSGQYDPWNRISMARGLAVYDPDTDESVADVLRRADDQMYENKNLMKGKHNGA